MCGIVGLFLKDRAARTGTRRTAWPACWERCATADRIPPVSPSTAPRAPGAIKLTIRGPRGYDYDAVVRRLQASGPALPHVVRDTHLVLTVPAARETAVRAKIAAMPELTIVGSGRRMEIFKEVGRPDRVAEAVRPRHHGRHARDRTHPHGDRIRGHDRRRASLHHRGRPMPGA